MNEARWLGHDATDRRERILTAAQQVFSARGFRVAEVQHIAEAAGVSKATIYKVFKSKDEILLTIVEENFVQLQRIVLANLVGPEQPLERFRKVLYAAAGYLDENKAFCRVLVREAGEFMPVIQRLYGGIVQSNAPMAEAFFAHLRRRGDIPDIPTQDLMRLLTNAGIGVLYAWVLRDEGTLAGEVDFYFETFAKVVREWRPGRPPAVTADAAR
jgi:AcrR family transcriptional regulator